MVRCKPLHPKRKGRGEKASGGWGKGRDLSERGKEISSSGKERGEKNDERA